MVKALKENSVTQIDLETLFKANVWNHVTNAGAQRPEFGRLRTTMDGDRLFVLHRVLNKSQSSKPIILREESLTASLYGSVTLLSDRPGAEIFLDSDATGKTKADVIQVLEYVPVGSHLLAVKDPKDRGT